MNKLSILVATAALVGSLSQSVVHAADLEIGILLPSPIADVGWSKALVDGMEAVKAKHGDGIKLNRFFRLHERRYQTGQT